MAAENVTHTHTGCGEASASFPADELKAGFPQESLPLKCSFLVTSSALLEKGLRWLDFSFILFQLNEGPLLDGSTSGFHSSPQTPTVASAVPWLARTALASGPRGTQNSPWENGLRKVLPGKAGASECSSYQ